MVHLSAAEKPPLTSLHIARRDHADQTSSQPTKNEKGQPAVDGFAQSDVQLLTSSPHLVVARKNFFDLFGSELVPLEMQYIAIIPVESRNNDLPSVA